MGVISRNAAAHWSNIPSASAFDGLSIAILPFASSAKLEQKMLDTVLRAGGASLSSVSSKGDVCLTQADVADFVVSDQTDAPSPAAVPRLEPLLECGGDVVVVSPEFFKSWVSMPETTLDAHLLFGRKSLPAGTALEAALALRGETTKKSSTKTNIAGKSTGAPPSEVRAQKKSAVETAAKGVKCPPKKATKRAAPAPVALSQRRQTRAKKMSEAPLAARVAKRRRVLRDTSNN
jgi:topoisomerase (DNA) II binding protein 1